MADTTSPFSIQLPTRYLRGTVLPAVEVTEYFEALERRLQREGVTLAGMPVLRASETEFMRWLQPGEPAIRFLYLGSRTELVVRGAAEVRRYVFSPPDQMYPHERGYEHVLSGDALVSIWKSARAASMEEMQEVCKLYDKHVDPTPAPSAGDWLVVPAAAATVVMAGLYVWYSIYDS